MAKRFSQLTPATQLNDTDIFAITQSFNSKSITGDLTAKYIMRNSSYADVIETITSDKDYLSSELEPDHRIFANSTSSDITLGFFNGADRDGTRVTIINTNVNVVFIELVSSGITNYILNTNETLEILWDITNNIWKVISKQLNGVYDIIVNSQEDFNSIIERVAVNQYKIKDSIKSAYFEFLSGGYQMIGGNSPLSGGDTWGYIQTNNCANIIFDPNNTYINAGQTEFYIEANTNYSVLKNITIGGGGLGIAADIKRSFLLNAEWVIFDNCKSVLRLSNSSTTFYAFEGANDFEKDIRANYINCIVTENQLNGTGIIGAFLYCYNIVNCIVKNCTNLNNNGIIRLFNTCKSINNNIITEINSVGNNFLTLFYNCTNINNFEIKTIDFVTAGTGSIILFDTCTNISNGIITDVDADDTLNICVDCSNVSNIDISDIESTSAVVIMGFTNNISNCKIDNVIASAGAITIADNCDRLNNLSITNLNANGNCIILTSCNYINNIKVQTVNGVNITGAFNCYYIDNILFTSCIGITTFKGYDGCSNMNNCRTSGCNGITVNGIIYCESVSNCTISGLTSSTGECNAYSNSYILTGCKASTITTTGGTTGAFGFVSCSQLSDCKAIDIEATGGTGSAWGFIDCVLVSNCWAEDIDSVGSTYHGFYQCTNVSACYAITCENGYELCNHISASTAISNDVYGFENCTNISGSFAITNIADGFFNCDELSACESNGNVNGFNECEQISASKAINNSVRGFVGCTGLTSNYATGNATYGFSNCYRMGFNRSNGNTTGQYFNCFADTVFVDAVADAAVGGYNTTT